MTTLADLIAKLEQADGPDRHLDYEILCAVDSHANTTRLPRFTSSIDAALTLVPEGFYGRVQPRFYSEYDRYEENRVFWEAYVIKPIWEKASPINDDYFETYESGICLTPYAALRIAALRAREEGKE